MDYSIEPVLPDNQIDRGNSFYDMLVTPGSTQTIKVQINNFSEAEQTFAVSVNTAATNANLNLDYTGKVTEKSTTAPLSVAAIAKYPETVKIPAKKAGLVSIELAIPEKEFDGIALGGIHVKKVSAQAEKEAEGIKSEYDYVLGLMLSENDNVVAPDLQLIDVATEVISNNAGLTVELENPQPINLSGVKMTGNIYQKEDRSQAVITRTIYGGKIAPNSRFKINFYNGEAGATKPLEAGDYVLQLDFADADNKTWHFEKAFTISKKEAAVVNNKVFVVKKDNTLLYVIIGILLAILLVAIFFFIFYLRRKKKDEQPAK